MAVSGHRNVERAPAAGMAHTTPRTGFAAPEGLLLDRARGIDPGMSLMLESSEAAILDRVVRPDAGDWPRAAAETILGLAFNRSDRDRMTRLLEKAKAGGLSPAQAEVLENYRHVGRLLELLKSRARRSLRANPPA